MKRNAAAEAAMQAKLAAIENARDAGRNFHKQQPELMLIAVSREGAARFTETDHIIAFMQGYTLARQQHEEFQMESER